MKNISRALWLILASMTLAWLVVERGSFGTTQFLVIRNLAVQYSGLIAMTVMSVAMILAVRPVWPERWFGGLDKMYRLHKWLGIAALIVGIMHWLASKGPKWAVGWGLMQRPQRGPRPQIEDPIMQWLASQRGTAEFIGEWAFYAAVFLIIVALIKLLPYKLFYQTHRLFPFAYLALVFHAVVLTKFSYWLSPIGVLLAPLLIAGTWASLVSIFQAIGRRKQAHGAIQSMQYYPGVKALEVVVDVPSGWKGHTPGQFAFVTSNGWEGAHPYTIASAWDESVHRITFVVKALGDHTNRLRDKLFVGQNVKIEGPYGCFTFDDDRKEQIWIGGGIGITPFIARMKQLARDGSQHPQTINLFHPTADHDEQALNKLATDAEAAGITMHILVDARDGLLDGEHIRKVVPNWRETSIWFCGPVGLGETLRRDFLAHGLDLERRFHQELFEMR